MINLLKIAEKVSSSFEYLYVDSTKCSKLRSSLSRCSKCIDVCPVEGIKINTDSIDIDQCINCGLCTVACSTGAITMRNPSIETLLSKVEYYSKRADHVYIYCSKHTPSEKNISTIQVPCLGSIHKETWLVMIKSQAEFEIFLPREGCNTCEVTGGQQALNCEMNKAKELLQQEISFVELEHHFKKNQDICDNNKRQWLSGVFSFAKQAPVKAIRNWTDDVCDEDENEEGKRADLISPRRNILAKFIKKYPDEAKKVKIKIPLINEKCELCSACSLLCPNQAITQTDQRIVINPLLCSECYLCQDICYYKAIDFIEIKADCLVQNVNNI